MKIPKKILLQVYFIIFILLNVFDFLGYLQGDFDFFKKLLSWTIIGYIFYKSSFTKIFLGTRDKIIDLILLLAFSLMTITKSIVLYVHLESTQKSNFLIFEFIIKFFQNIKEITTFEQTLFIIGLIIIIFISFYSLKKYVATKDSLIGSFNLKGYIKFVGGEYIILIFTLTFFSLIVFNFFMEWFALAVDSVILVIGLIYYIIKYLHKHTKLNTEKYLGTISNTGNNFYQNLINQFSNKKTFLIGTSLILTIHLIVDIGVYLIPYLLGNPNALYASSINTPLINIFNYQFSQIYLDFTIANYNPLLILTILVSYMTTILFYFLVMLGPFYYFYKFITNNKTHSPDLVKYIFLTVSILYLSLFLIPDLNPNITINSALDNSQIIGVNFNTHQTITQITNTTMLSTITFLVLSLIVSIGIYYTLKNTNSKIIKYKLMPTIALIFFIIYISMFFFSIAKLQTTTIQEKFTLNDQVKGETEYNDLSNKIKNDEIDKYETISIGSNYYNLKLTPLKDIKSEYILFNLENIDTTKKYNIKNLENIYFENSKDYQDFKFQKGNVMFIYQLENNSNVFDKQINQAELIEIIKPIIGLKQNTTLNNLEIIRFFFTAIFYIFGSIAFIRLFLKEKILN